MSFWDWAVFLLFLTYVVADGVRRGRGAKNLEGYFAGNRSIPWWAAGLSIMATQASAITIIGTTGQGHEGGMEFVQVYFGLAFAMVLLSIFFVPLYRRQAILTAYQYLEDRFGPGTRSMASLVFLVSRCLAFGVVLYAPAVVLSAMLHLDVSTTVLIMGALTTLYTMVGGVHAVIWTDVKQMTVIIGGLLLCLGLLLWHVLPQTGFWGMFEVLGATGKLNAVELVPESLDLLPRFKAEAEGGVAQGKSFWEDSYNFWAGMLGGLFLHLSYFGCDQSQVQRILTNPSARESRLALLLSAFAKVPMQALVLFIGVLLYLFFLVGAQDAPLLFNPNDRASAQDLTAIEAVYAEERGRQRELALQIAAQAGGEEEEQELLAEFQGSVRKVAGLRSQALAQLGQNKKDVNFIFPHFALHYVPTLLLGLIMAAIFAAAMSSADSALNSLTASSIVDFYQRWWRPQASDRELLRASRLTTLFWGAAATTAALYLGGEGSVIELINKVGSFFYGSLLGVFALALLCRRARGVAAVSGLLAGMASVWWVDAYLHVAYLWYNVVGCVVVLLVGFVLSRLRSHPR